MRDTLRNQLEQDGYVVLEDFLRPAECDELLAAGLELTKNVSDLEQKSFFSTIEPETKHLKEKYFMESNDKISYFFEVDALDADGKLKVDPSVSLNKVGHALHLLHPIFRCYTYSDRVKAVCRELGFKEPAVVQSMYIYKNPGLGGEDALACEPADSQHGCKIYGVSCTCGYGCKSEFMYRTRRACLSALRGRSSNTCYRLPCVRGICIQTVQEPGFTCKCEGTGFFGLRCEKACPTVLMRGLVFPHECIVI